MDDFELLQAYVSHHAEEAFTKLVNRHIHLVYSAALRQTRAPQMAQEVTQAVFVVLAQKAASIRAGTMLAGWLLRTTHYTAANARRLEQRRHNTEREAMENLSSTGPDPAWEQVAPLLDEALVKLREKDRSAIVLRFFEQKSFKEVGAVMGLTENSARMRVTRALERLRRFFARRGVAVSAVTLGAALSVGAVQAAPAGLVASVTGATAAQGAGATASTMALAKLTLSFLLWSQVKKIAVIGLPALLLLEAGIYVVPSLRERLAAVNLMQNGTFEEHLKNWYGYVDENSGARAVFTSEAVPGSRGFAAKIVITRAGYYDCVELDQTGITVQARHHYAVSFRARSTVRQPLRVKIIQASPPWAFYGFRAVTEITPRWQTYRLTSRALVTANDGKLMFQCGGEMGEIWIDDVKFQDLGGHF